MIKVDFRKVNLVVWKNIYELEWKERKGEVESGENEGEIKVVEIW